MSRFLYPPVSSSITNPSFGGFFDTATQPLASITAEQQVAIAQAAYVRNITRFNTGDIQYTNAGTYTFTFSVLFTNPTAQAEYANLYIKFNGVTVPGTSTAVVVPAKHGSVSGTLSAGNTYIVPMNANDVVSLWWAGTSLSLSIISTPAVGFIPAADGVLFSTHQIS